MSQVNFYNKVIRMVLSRLLFVMATSALVLVGCNSKNNSNSTSNNSNNSSVFSTVDDTGKPAVVETNQQAAIFLNRATFGATQQDISKLKSINYGPWLANQFAKSVCYHTPIFDRLMSDQGFEILIDGEELGHRLRARSDAWWYGAIECDDQLRQRVAYALSQILVVSEKGPLGSRPRGLARYQDTLLKHAFGNFRALLEDVTLSPMMGEYLSMMGNRKGNDEGTRLPDENYAREIMQLFTIGLVELNIDGTPKLDSNGKTIDTYDQEIIKAFARVFTGWTCSDNESFGGCKRTIGSEANPMIAFDDQHDSAEKILLNGAVLPANQTAQEDLKGGLDNLFNHPNVGPFIGKQLIQRLVTSNPSPQYVARVARVFNDNGKGVRGDLKAVTAAILLDSEALTPSDNTYAFGKMKEPILKLTGFWRAFDAKGEHGVLRYTEADREFGQQAFKSPSVFNFYKPSYSDGAFSDLSLVCPECQIINDSTVVTTQNRLRSYIREENQGGDNLQAARHKILLDFDTLKSMASTPSALVNEIDARLFAYSMSDELKTIIIDHVSSIEDNEQNTLRLQEALLLAMASPEYSVQR